MIHVSDYLTTLSSPLHLLFWASWLWYLWFPRLCCGWDDIEMSWLSSQTILERNNEELGLFEEWRKHWNAKCWYKCWDLWKRICIWIDIWHRKEEWIRCKQIANIGNYKYLRLGFLGTVEIVIVKFRTCSSTLILFFSLHLSNIFTS